MDTITRERVSVQLEGARELLEGASLCAAKGKSAPSSLTCVALRVDGERGQLIARATDRYRLIVGSITVEGEDRLGEILISLPDIKRIVDLMKGITIGYLIIEREDSGRVSFRVNANASLTVEPLTHSFPTPENFAQLLKEPDTREPISEIAFNPSLFADFAKIVGKDSAVKVTFNAANKPITIGLTGDKVAWSALLMPMRTV